MNNPWRPEMPAPSPTQLRLAAAIERSERRAQEIEDAAEERLLTRLLERRRERQRRGED
jgi:hypothetical protein